VGDEVTFAPSGRVLEGIVMDIGWYRTLIRSFEREVYVIPNAVFSKNVVLNITRKGKEWRFYEFLNVRLQDVQKVRGLWVRRGVECDDCLYSGKACV
jgi:small-conductance mechanosensitive channel